MTTETTIQKAYNIDKIDLAYKLVKDIDFDKYLIALCEQQGTDYNDKVNQERGIWDSYFMNEIFKAKDHIKTIKRLKVLNRWAVYILKNEQNILSIKQAIKDKYRFNNTSLLVELWAISESLIREYELIGQKQLYKKPSKDITFESYFARTAFIKPLIKELKSVGIIDKNEQFIGLFSGENKEYLEFLAIIQILREKGYLKKDVALSHRFVFSQKFNCDLNKETFRKAELSMKHPEHVKIYNAYNSKILPPPNLPLKKR